VDAVLVRAGVGLGDAGSRRREAGPPLKLQKLAIGLRRRRRLRRGRWTGRADTRLRDGPLGRPRLRFQILFGVGGDRRGRRLSLLLLFLTRNGAQKLRMEGGGAGEGQQRGEEHDPHEGSIARNALYGPRIHPGGYGGGRLSW